MPSEEMLPNTTDQSLEKGLSTVSQTCAAKWRSNSQLQENRLRAIISVHAN